MEDKKHPVALGFIVLTTVIIVVSLGLFQLGQLLVSLFNWGVGFI
jgi:hypothetical protein